MRITYRQLCEQYYPQLSEDQKDTDVTVEMFDEESSGTIAVAADFRICGQEIADDLGLETNHPIIYVGFLWNDDRSTNGDVQEHIDAIRAEGGFGPVGD